MVDHDHEDVVAFPEFEQGGAHRHVGGDVEAGRCQRDDPLRQFLLVGHADDVEPGLRVGCGPDDLVGAVDGIRVHRAQRFVPGNDIRDRRPQRVDVQCAGEPQRQRDVVLGRFGIEPVGVPHPLLCQRQRQPVRTRSGGDGRTRAAVHTELFQPARQLRHRGSLEDLAHRSVDADGLVDMRHHAGGSERVSAEREEGVVGTDHVDTEHLREHRGDPLLESGSRGTELTVLHQELGLGQGAAVEFAHRGERDGVEGHDRRRHHVRGHELAHEVQHPGDVHLGARHREHVRHEDRIPGRSGQDRRRGEVDGGVLGEHRVDLAEFDAESADLHLLVRAADVVDGQRAVRVLRPAHDVAGAVHPFARLTVRVRDEASRGQRRAPVVATGESETGQIEVTCDADRNGAEPIVEDQCAGAADRTTDRDRAVGGHRVADVGHDRGLGGTVSVEQRASGCPARREFRRDGLAAGDDELEVVEPGRIHGRQRRRRDEAVRDAMLAQELRELGSAVHIGGSDHHRGTGTDREQQFEHGRVEARRREVQRPRVRRHLVTLTLFGREVGETPVRHDDALGLPGGAGRVDHVGAVGRCHRRATLRLRDGGRGVPLGGVLEVFAVEDQPVDVRRKPADLGAHGKPERHTRIGDHVRDALVRVPGIDRHVGAAALGDGPDADDRRDRSGDAEPDERLRADSVLDQDARQTVRALVQLAVGDALAARDDRVTVGIRGDGRGQQFDESRGRGALDTADRCQFLGLLGVEDGDVSYRDVGSAACDGGEDPHETVREALHGLRVEDLGGEPEDTGDPGGRALVRPQFAQVDGEVELAELDVHGTGCRLESGELEGRDAVDLMGQHDLEQRRVRRRPGRLQGVHQLLERDVLMAERGEVLGADLLEQFGEGRSGLDLGPQHQCVDEHADEVFERLVTAAGHSGADGNVGTRTEPCQQHGQRRVQHHEQRHVVCARDLTETTVGVLVDGEADGGACHRPHRRAGPVGGEGQDVGHTREGLRPEVDLRRGQRIGVVLGTENVPLPQRVVRVLDRQRRPRGLRPLQMGRVGRHDVAGERQRGRAVGRDVVHDQYQHVVGRAEPEQAGPDRDRVGDVEAGGTEFEHPVPQVVLADVDRLESEVDVGGGQDHLVRTGIGVREHGPQHLVPCDDVGVRRSQCSDVQFAAQSHGERNVVRRRRRIETVQEPHPLLRERQRQLPRALARDQCRPGGTVVGPVLDELREGGNGRSVEQITDPDLGAGRGRDTGSDTGGAE
nr:hypothetical protein GCM10017611_84510 [Rhodococcus wratislaviensis]